VLDKQNTTATAWQFTATAGTITAAPDDLARAVFTAPATMAQMTVTVTATDPLDATRTASTTIQVFPLVGTFVVVPSKPLIGPAPPVTALGNIIVGLGNAQFFDAQMTIQAAGGPIAIPIRRVFWKVNGVYKGSFLGALGAGKIQDNGRYAAPLAMPQPLPFPVKVGFSLTG